MALHLGTRFIDAKSQIEGAVNLKKLLEFGIYGENLIRSYAIELVSIDTDDMAEDSFSNFHILIEANEVEIFVNEKNKLHLDLYFLCSSSAYFNWTSALILKVWGNDFPSTVAIDKETKQIYFVYLRETSIKLELFGVLTDEQYQTVSDSLVESKPFEIGIGHDAMYAYIDGSEGFNHLRENIFVEFKCGIDFKVFKNTSLITESE